MKDFIAYTYSGKSFHFLSALPSFIKGPTTHLIPSFFKAKLRYRRLPSALTLFVTNRCNLRCRHCGICRSEGISVEKEMGLNDYQKIFRKAKNIFASIKITGGEPTLRDDLAQIIASAAKDGGIKYATLFTNGTHLSCLQQALEEVMESCGIKINIQVSVDGDEQLHDEIRGKKGAYADVIKAMKMLSDIRKNYPRRILRLSAATCIMRENEHNFMYIANMVRSYGFEHVVSFPRSNRLHVFNIGNDWKSDYYPVRHCFFDAEEMAARLKMVDAILWRGRDMSLFKKINKITLETMVEVLKTKKPKSPCYSGRADLIVYPDGDVARCEMLKSGANVADYDHDIRSLILSDRYRNYLKNTDSCWCLHDCAIGLSIIYEPCLFKKLFNKN